MHSVHKISFMGSWSQTKYPDIHVPHPYSLISMIGTNCLMEIPNDIKQDVVPDIAGTMATVMALVLSVLVFLVIFHLPNHLPRTFTLGELSCSIQLLAVLLWKPVHVYTSVSVCHPLAALTPLLQHRLTTVAWLLCLEHYHARTSFHNGNLTLL